MIRELKRAPWWAKVFLGIVVLIVVLAIVGSLIPSDEDAGDVETTADPTVASMATRATIPPSVPDDPIDQALIAFEGSHGRAEIRRQIDRAIWPPVQ